MAVGIGDARHVQHRAGGVGLVDDDGERGEAGQGREAGDRLRAEALGEADRVRHRQCDAVEHDGKPVRTFGDMVDAEEAFERGTELGRVLRADDDLRQGGRAVGVQLPFGASPRQMRRLVMAGEGEDARKPALEQHVLERDRLGAAVQLQRPRQGDRVLRGDAGIAQRGGGRLGIGGGEGDPQAAGAARREDIGQRRRRRAGRGDQLDIGFAEHHAVIGGRAAAMDGARRQREAETAPDLVQGVEGGSADHHVIDGGKGTGHRHTARVADVSQAAVSASTSGVSVSRTRA